MKSRFMLIGTPSGITLGPEGGAKALNESCTTASTIKKISDAKTETRQ